jgi:hypothetical protein
MMEKVLIQGIVKREPTKVAGASHGVNKDNLARENPDEAKLRGI